MKTIALDANVYCSDEWCGLVTHILVNPQTRRVTHLVVKESGPAPVERLVPIDAVLTMSPERIQLRCSPDEFKLLDPFVQIEHHSEMVPDYENAAQVGWMLPYIPQKRVWIETRWKQIPPDELSLHRGVPVQANDGSAGTVAGLKVEPASGHIQQLLVRQGLPWNHRQVAVPISHVEHAEENIVYLKLDKDELAALPEIQTNHSMRRNEHLPEHY